MAGLIHIYCGDGKGKTSAAVGLALRAAGAGMKVLFVQFLKDGSSSELPMLQRLGIETACCSGHHKFVFQMTEEEREMAARDLYPAAFGFPQPLPGWRRAAGIGRSPPSL